VPFPLEVEEAELATLLLVTELEDDCNDEDDEADVETALEVVRALDEAEDVTLLLELD
jgi:hypothetical protein